MDIDSGHTYTKQKQGFSKIKKILKPLFPRKLNGKRSPIKSNDDSSSFTTHSKKHMNKSKKSTQQSRIRGLKLLSLQDNYSLNSNNKTVTSSSKSFNESDSDHGSCNTFESHSSIGTWTSENGDHDMMFYNFDLIHNDDQKSQKPSNSTIDITKNYKDVVTAAATGLMNSSSSHTLYVKDMVMDEDGVNNNHTIEINSESSSDVDFVNSLSSNSSPSILSLGSMTDKYNSNNNVPQWVINNKKNKNNNIKIPPSPPTTPLPPTIFNSKRNIKVNYKGKYQTPPILTYFPCEILIHIAMSSDFDTILSLKQTCRFFYSILDIPSNWSDYWKYTSDRVECLNSLVTSVFQGDEYIFGEILNPTNDKYITNMKKDQDPMVMNDASHSSPVRPNYIYKMPNDSGMEIPIEKILFIDYFSTRLGFSYLGGLRIYVPYEYGNNIVHFYDRTAQELPCSLEHYQDYERNKLRNDLVTNTNALELPSPVQECSQCNQYYHTNCIDYTVTCSGRPVSHISAIWKYQVTPKYTISFDIINSRSEYGYGYRTQDAFIHINYSFLVNGKELSPAKAALFRKYVLKSS
jgi:hypothetical protein